MPNAPQTKRFNAPLALNRNEIGTWVRQHDLLLVARENDWLLDTEFGEFVALAKLRNPYAHYRSFRHPDSLRERSAATGEEPDLILQSDCERFLVRLHAFVHRRFGIGPLKVLDGLKDPASINSDQLEIDI